MKLRKFGQAALALAVGIGSSFGLTSCVQSHTVGYLYVTGHQYNQVGAFKINNNNGNLSSVGTISSGGTNPVDAILAQAGKFLYVLNAGCADPAVFPDAKYPCAAGQAPVASNVSLFTIGGNGILTFQASYPSNGLNSVALSLDTSGSFLYVLDQNTPQVGTTPSQYLDRGDISVFSLSSSTGRLSTVLNLQLQQTNSGPNPPQLTFFPVGNSPVWFKLYNGYVFTIDRNDGALPNPTYVNVYSSNGSGQLLTTQNSEFPTGATNLVYANAGSTYLYLLDAGTPNDSTSPLYTGAIYAYTVVSGGALSSIAAGAQTQASLTYTSAVNPTVLTVESSNKYLYVANAGLNTGQTSAASSITAYIITSNGQLQPIAGAEAGLNNSGSGVDPRCILEDPSNQYIFTANYNDSTITGKILNTQAGALTPLRGTNTFTAPGNPTWCVASGNLF